MFLSDTSQGTFLKSPGKIIFYLNINLGCEESVTSHPVSSGSFLSTSGGGFRKNAPNKLSPIIRDP